MQSEGLTGAFVAIRETKSSKDELRSSYRQEFENRFYAFKNQRGKGSKHLPIERQLTALEKKFKAEIQMLLYKPENLERGRLIGTDGRLGKASDLRAQVLALFNGMTQPEINRASIIAKKLGVTAKTVRKHLNAPR